MNRSEWANLPLVDDLPAGLYKIRGITQVSEGSVLRLVAVRSSGSSVAEDVQEEEGGQVSKGKQPEILCRYERTGGVLPDDYKEAYDAAFCVWVEVHEGGLLAELKLPQETITALKEIMEAREARASVAA